MVVIVVADVVPLREEQAVVLVPRRTPSRTSSWWWLIFEFPANISPPLSESESDESPVNGTDRIWLARYNNNKQNISCIIKWKTIGKTSQAQGRQNKGRGISRLCNFKMNLNSNCDNLYFQSTKTYFLIIIMIKVIN